ncbi:unnamed protein product [Camellia sinensis]
MGFLASVSIYTKVLSSSWNGSKQLAYQRRAFLLITRMERKNDDKAAHYHAQWSITIEPEESQSLNTSDDDDDLENTKEQPPNKKSHSQSQSQSSPNFDSDDISEEPSSEEPA